MRATWAGCTRGPADRQQVAQKYPLVEAHCHGLLDRALLHSLTFLSSVPLVKENREGGRCRTLFGVQAGQGVRGRGSVYMSMNQSTLPGKLLRPTAMPAAFLLLVSPCV